MKTLAQFLTEEVPPVQTVDADKNYLQYNGKRCIIWGEFILQGVSNDHTRIAVPQAWDDKPTLYAKLQAGEPYSVAGRRVRVLKIKNKD